MVRNIIGVALALLAAVIWIVIAVQLGVEDSMMRTMISSALAAVVFCACYFSGKKPEETQASAAT